MVASAAFATAPQAYASNKPTPKASPSSEAKSKKKVTKKKVTKKKVTKKKVTKKKPRKISKPIPSPAPKWPPKGFREVDGVYISTPKSEKELVGVLSAKTTLLSEIRACEKNVCAVIYVASERACKWWQVQSIIIGRSADVLGNLQTLAKGSKARERKTIILISKEPVEEYAEILNMKAFCRNDAVSGKVPSNTFTPNPALAPTPTPSPTATPTETASPASSASAAASA
jgi:hypothetical protein